MWTIPYDMYSGAVNTTAVTGDAVDLRDVAGSHTFSVAFLTGSGGVLLHRFEGSLDGENFYALTPTQEIDSLVTSAYVSAVPARYVRCVAYMTGGSGTVAVTGTSSL